MEFRTKLKELRARKGVTQQQLADAVLTSRSTVAKWESGRCIPNDKSLELLAEYFGVDKGELIGDKAVEDTYVRKNIALSRSKKIIIALSAVCAALIIVFVLLWIFVPRTGDEPVGNSFAKVVGTRAEVGYLLDSYSDGFEEAPRDEQTDVYTLEVGGQYTIYVSPILTGGSAPATYDGYGIEFLYDGDIFDIALQFPNEEGEGAPPCFVLTILGEANYSSIIVTAVGYSTTITIFAAQYPAANG